MAEIPLTRGKVAIVDDADYERLSQWNWYAKEYRCGIWYAVRTSKTIRMHRFIVDAERGQIVDHWDRDGLNNQRSNLRVCTHSQNLANRAVSGNKASCSLKGVYPAGSGWCAKVVVQKRLHHLGTFRTQEEAAREYDRVAIEKFGEFARTNFPRTGDQSGTQV